jgi:hypothetical protein
MLEMTDLQVVKDKLQGPRYRAGTIPRVGDVGVYALFLIDPAALTRAIIYFAK